MEKSFIEVEIIEGGLGLGGKISVLFWRIKCWVSGWKCGVGIREDLGLERYIWGYSI